MPFTIVIPTLPVITPVQIQENVWVADLVNPSRIHNITFFLNTPLNTLDEGAAIYYSFPPFNDLEFLGVITNSRPSDSFTTGWPFLEFISQVNSIRIVIRIEPATDLLIKIENKPQIDVNKEIAKKIALNLFRYIESYSNTTRIDQSIFDKWILRFEEKSKLDPYFFMKTN